MENILWGYILFMSVLTFSVCGVDKFAAQRQKRRVPEKVLFLAALLGGAAMYSGVFIMSSGIAFFTVRALDWIYIFTNASYQVTRIPMPYLPRALKGAFTFVVPMLVISYYPASALCGWGDPPALGLLALPAGLAFLGASLLVWRLGVRHYRSAGS